MPPPQQEKLSRQSGEEIDLNRTGTRVSDGVFRAGDGTQRLRNEESWIEISSRPSSSSLSSVGDEIVTTGLRVQPEPNLRRRKRPYIGSPSRMTLSERHASSSSQEEYDESESEEDRVLASSNERILSYSGFNLLDKDRVNDTGAESTDDDENATALGRVNKPAVFTPQPNVFTHPPSVENCRRQSVTSPSHARSAHPAYPNRQPCSGRPAAQAQTSHSPYSTISPSYQADHDAALRASLTTLLSCAAAARGLPKRNRNNALGANAAPHQEFTGIRLVPESELTGSPPATSSPSSRSQSNPSISGKNVITDKGKRKATTRPNAPSRAIKKKKMTVMEEAIASPTLLTWVVGAGVVVLVSVVGFSAGYAIGKEVGKREALNGLTISENASCGKEAAKQLSEIRKFRWTNGRGIVV